MSFPALWPRVAPFAGQPLTPDELNRFADTAFDAADAFAEKAQSRSR